MWTLSKCVKVLQRYVTCMKNWIWIKNGRQRTTTHLNFLIRLMWNTFGLCQNENLFCDCHTHTHTQASHSTIFGRFNSLGALSYDMLLFMRYCDIAGSNGNPFTNFISNSLSHLAYATHYFKQHFWLVSISSPAVSNILMKIAVRASSHAYLPSVDIVSSGMIVFSFFLSGLMSSFAVCGSGTFNWNDELLIMIVMNFLENYFRMAMRVWRTVC